MKTRERHGLAGTPEYNSWMHMKARCYNPKNKNYEVYGKRGIIVCERWVKSFTAFYNAVGARPTSSHTLDRIDSNGNYEPGNVRWATRRQQAHNRRIRSNNTSGFVGVSWVKLSKKWVAQISLGEKRINLGLYDTKEEAAYIFDQAAIQLFDKARTLNLLKE